MRELTGKQVLNDQEDSHEHQEPQQHPKAAPVLFEVYRPVFAVAENDDDDKGNCEQNSKDPLTLSEHIFYF